MLFRSEFLQGIRDGSVTLAFRRWRRPTVRPGGTLLTPVGELAIRSVTRIEADQISAAEARRAGHASLEALRDELRRRPTGDVYRIELGELRPDPRIALRAARTPGAEEIRAAAKRLRRLDVRAPQGPWTEATLEAIGRHVAVRAADLCRLVGQEKDAFKRNVRKLGALGLTESLGTGYRLSPRGRAVLRALRSTAPRSSRVRKEAREGRRRDR